MPEPGHRGQKPQPLAETLGFLLQVQNRRGSTAIGHRAFGVVIGRILIGHPLVGGGKGRIAFLLRPVAAGCGHALAAAGMCARISNAPSARSRARSYARRLKRRSCFVAGLLGMHAIQERPVAREGNVVIRPMMYVALTYDHRVADGREAVSFLRRIKDVIESPPRMLMEI